MEGHHPILASLYMIRSDTSVVVLQVEQSVVVNTPATLRRILYTLMGTIVNTRAGNNLEKQESWAGEHGMPKWCYPVHPSGAHALYGRGPGRVHRAFGPAACDD